MLEHEEFIKEFEFGISVLTAYLKYNNKENYTDINVITEGFIKELLNILFGWQLIVPPNPYMPGYDLISVQDKIVVQVSTACTPKKIRESFSGLGNYMAISSLNRERFVTEIERTQKDSTLDSVQKEGRTRKYESKLNSIIDISGFTVFFMFLKEDADNIIKHGKGKEDEFIAPNGLLFNQYENVLSFQTLINKVTHLSQLSDGDTIKSLKILMRKNRIFRKINDISQLKDKINSIIDEYAGNYQSPLFLHRYDRNTKVTLENLFVEPQLTPIDYSAYTSAEVGFRDTDEEKSIISILDSFLWDHDRDRLLFIEGDAAIGKSSLVSWLCFHYREYDDIGKSLFLNVRLICIRLKNFSVLEGETVEKSVCRYLSLTSIEEINSHYENALIVLEGADELALNDSGNSINVESFILSIRQMFSNHKIIITSRTKYIKMDQFLNQVQAFTFQHYAIKHFSGKERRKWIENYTNKCEGNVDNATFKYISELTDESASGIADTPLGLYLIVCNGANSSLVRNKWSLYREILHNAIFNIPYEESFKSPNGTSHRALTKQDASAGKVYELIGHIAYKMFINRRDDRNDVTKNEVEEILKSKDFDVLRAERDSLRISYVLATYWKSNRPSDVYEFYHNNIRDFFMAEYIHNRFFAKPFSNNTQEMIEYLINTASSVFQYGLIPNSTWAQTFLFLYERLRSENSKNTIDANRIIEIERLYSKTIYEIVNNPHMWAYSYEKDYYDSIKYTFMNFVLFLRVWIYAINPNNLNTFAEKEFYDFFHRQSDGIFYDWISIFSNSIELQKDKHMAFGSHMNYSNMVFSDLNFKEACFESSHFTDCDFSNSNLMDSIFCWAQLCSVDFNGADLSNAVFDNSTIVNSKFDNTQLSGASFGGATIESIDFSKLAMAHEMISFNNAAFMSTTLKNISTEKFSFGDDEVKFDNCTLSNLSFDTNAKNLVFENSTIENVCFKNIDYISFIGKENEKKLTQVSFSGSFKRIEFNMTYVERCGLDSTSISQIAFLDCTVDNLSLREARIKKIVMDRCTINGVVDLYKAIITRSAINALEKSNATLKNGEFVSIIEDYS